MNKPALQRQRQAVIKAYGVDVTINGVAVKATTIALSETEANAFFPEGNRNASNGEPRQFNISPLDATPAENGEIVYNGATYRIVRIAPTTLGSAVRCICYREAQENTAVVAPAGETGAGSVKPYRPPASTH